MTINFENQTLYPTTDSTRQADSQSRVNNEVMAGNSTVEKDEIAAKWSSIFSSQRVLTPEEQRRVEFLKNLLLQTLTMAQGDPTEDQKKQIREIEDELEKITGVKTRSRISTVTDKMPGKDDEDQKKEKQEQQARGIDPKDAIHNNVEIKPQSMNPGMQMLRQNAFMLDLNTLTTSFESTILTK